VAVQVSWAPGARVVVGQLIAERPGMGSVTSMVWAVTLPELITWYE